MKVLVTGGLGFIGSHIVDTLVEQGNDVRVLDNLEYQVHKGHFPAHARADVENVIGSVLDRELLDVVLEDVEVVFHQAAAVGMGQSMYQVHKYTDVNVAGTAMLLDRIVNTNVPVKKVLVAASMASYGEGLYECASCGPVSPPVRGPDQMRRKEWDVTCPRCNGPAHPVPTPETKSLDSLAIYSLTKRYQEELCMSIGKTYGIPVVSTRYFNVYGPRQSLSNPYTGVMAIFTSRIKNGNPPFVYEDGLQSRDFIHVEDVARANAFLMGCKNAEHEVVNLGTREAVSIKRVAELLIQALGQDMIPVLSNEGRPGDVRHCIADISKLKRFGFEHVHPSLDVAELVAWSKGVAAVDSFDTARNELETKLGR